MRKVGTLVVEHHNEEIWLGLDYGDRIVRLGVLDDNETVRLFNEAVAHGKAFAHAMGRMGI